MRMYVRFVPGADISWATSLNLLSKRLFTL